MSRKFVRLPTAVFLAGALSFSAFSQGTQTFDRLKLDFQVRRAEIQKKTLDEPQAALNAKYQGFLVKLKESAAAKGDLDRALAISKVIEEFGKGTVPGGATDPEIKRAQEIYRAESATIHATHGRELKPLLEAYIKRLGDIVTELTKSQNLEMALTARQESDAMAALLKSLAGSDPAKAPSIASPMTPPASASPLSVSSGKQGKVLAFGKFYGNRDAVGSRDRFVALQPRGQYGWFGLRPNGLVATDLVEEVSQFKGRIAKLCETDFQDTFPAIDTTGRLQIVSIQKGPEPDVPTFEKKVIDAALCAGRQMRSSLALLEDGTLKYWGNAYDGSKTPVPSAALTNIRAISVNGLHCFAVRQDGKVVAWELGVGEKPVPDHISDVVAIDAGTQFAIVLTSKGEVLAWGDAGKPAAQVPANLGRCVAVRANGDVAAAKQENGKWIAWGSNTDAVIDKIGTLESTIDLVFYGAATPGFNGFAAWIE